MVICQVYKGSFCELNILQNQSFNHSKVGTDGFVYFPCSFKKIDQNLVFLFEILLGSHYLKRFWNVILEVLTVFFQSENKVFGFEFEE